LIEGPTHALSKGKARWCGICAKAHEGAIDIGRRKCETCQVKTPSFGFVSDGKARWCSACSKEHEGTKDVLNNKEYKHVRVATRDKDRVAETHARLTAQNAEQKKQLEMAGKTVDWLEAKLEIALTTQEVKGRRPASQSQLKRDLARFHREHGPPARALFLCMIL
jgi:hypothetical protein